jgi:hypothetical protein
MKYPNIAVVFDEFDEEYQVVEQVSSYIYREMASFKNQDDARTFATTKATEKGLGKVVLKTRKS